MIKVLKYLKVDQIHEHEKPQWAIIQLSRTALGLRVSLSST